MNTHFNPRIKKTILASISLAFIASLSACGGNSTQSVSSPWYSSTTPTVPNVPNIPNPSNPNPGTTPNVPTIPSTNPSNGGTPTSFVPSASVQNQCAAPRPNTEDRQGSIALEKSFLRSYLDESYLWYKEIPNVDATQYTTPESYFEVLKTSRTTASGRPVDEFHWSVTQEEFDNISSGIDEGYGVTWAQASNRPPRKWTVANVEPLSAAGAVLKRGDILYSVDGENFESGNNLDILNGGLFPNSVTSHTFEVIRNGSKLSFTMTPSLVTTTPVRYANTYDTPSGKVGYIYFDDHITKSEPMLIDAFNLVKSQGARDLVLDLRYNGGGLLSIASRTAYMVGGNNTANKDFERIVFNDKMASDNSSWPFFNQASTDAGGGPLPSLDLKRVYVLVGGGTASASESIINGLRGADIEVILIGDTTRGKPYGFYPQPNCGRVYYAIQFKGENNKGFGDYADGFTPNCRVSDDLTKELGSPLEARFAAALSYRDTGRCPAPTSLSSSLKSGGGLNYVVPNRPSKELKIPR